MKKSVKTLTGKQNRHLRSLGHHLHAVVQVGKEGVTGALMATIDREPTAHELIKLKVLETAPEEPAEAASIIARGNFAHIAQVVGRTILMYRAHPDKPRIVLPV